METTEYWNYRVILKENKGSKVFEIYEVYYNKKNEIVCWTEESIAPYGEALYELKKDIFYMMSAFKYPVLKEKEKDGKTILVEEKKEDNVKLTKFHYFEAMDRMSVVLGQYDEYIASHPAVKQNKKLLKFAEKLTSKMYDFYGKLSLKVFKK